MCRIFEWNSHLLTPASPFRKKSSRKSTGKSLCQKFEQFQKSFVVRSLRPPPQGKVHFFRTSASFLLKLPTALFSRCLADKYFLFPLAIFLHLFDTNFFADLDDLPQLLSLPYNMFTYCLIVELLGKIS